MTNVHENTKVKDNNCCKNDYAKHRNTGNSLIYKL